MKDLNNIQLKNGDKEFLSERISKLINFLDEISEEDNGVKVSAGDLFGYICGYLGTDSDPEDEIEVF